LLTACTDSKIRIWATAPILDAALEADTSANRLLCTLSRHTGELRRAARHYMR
jgi:protein HIRA/HIR1